MKPMARSSTSSRQMRTRERLLLTWLMYRFPPALPFTLPTLLLLHPANEQDAHNHDHEKPSAILNSCSLKPDRMR